MQASESRSTEQPKPLLLNRRVAANILSISERKLWELSATGEIKTVKIGRSVRYQPEELLRFITSLEEGVA